MFGIELLNIVELKVVEIELGIKGDMVLGGIKFVKMEIGFVVNVLFFVNEGDMFVVNILDGFYVLRV